MASARATTPFLHASTQSAALAAGVVPEVHEDVSDGLMLCRRTSWFMGSRLRSDCRCGCCPSTDPEPCPYALPARHSDSMLSSLATAGRRSLSRLLSVREPAKEP